MIKINLLPKSIYEKNAVRNMAILMGIVFVVIVVGCLSFASAKRNQVAQIEAAASAAEAMKAEVDGIKSEAEKIRGEIQPIKAKLDFILGVLDYNTKFPKLYEEIAKWTYEKVSYTSMVCNGASVQMQMQVKTLDDLGRYLMNMYRATDLFTSVQITSGLPGYPANATQPGQGEQGGALPPIGGGGMDIAGINAISAGVVRKPQGGSIAVTVDCVLKNPIVAPTPGGTAATGAAGTPAAPGAPTMPTPGPMPGGAPGAMPGPPMPGPMPAG